MNPLCPKCRQPMVLKMLGHTVGATGKGRSKFWVCRKCKRRYKAGRNVIR